MHSILLHFVAILFRFSHLLSAWICEIKSRRSTTNLPQKSNNSVLLWEQSTYFVCVYVACLCTIFRCWLLFNSRIQVNRWFFLLYVGPEQHMNKQKYAFSHFSQLLLSLVVCLFQIDVFFWSGFSSFFVLHQSAFMFHISCLYHCIVVVVFFVCFYLVWCFFFLNDLWFVTIINIDYCECVPFNLAKHIIYFGNGL